MRWRSGKARIFFLEQKNKKVLYVSIRRSPKNKSLLPLFFRKEGLSSRMLIELEDFSVSYGKVKAVNNVSLRIDRGDVLGILGESGSGKSTLALALMALLPKQAQVSGRLAFEGVDLARLDAAGRRALRGRRIAAVFQDPFASLNPVMRIGTQLRAFAGSPTDAAINMLRRVGISEPERRMRQYPFELSGGLRQRVAIAAALLCAPTVLVADEPTTALDAATERQILALLRESRALVDGAMVIVSHDLSVLAALCTRIAVVYAGEVVELGTAADLLQAPRHPYTRALLACDLRRSAKRAARFPSIAGQLPNPAVARRGCVFAPRCSARLATCADHAPPVVARPFGFVRCHAMGA
jgi:peptide/nickel transport system ATP-binding protein